MAGLSTEASLKLLQSGKFSDFTVICEGKEIKVHRMIVCAQSREWSAACDGTLIGFPTSRAEIRNHDLATVSRVLLFLYTGNYDDKIVPDLGKALPGTEKLESHAQLSSDDESTLIEESEQTLEIKSQLDNKGKKDGAVMEETLGTQLVVNAKVYLCAKTLKIDDLLALALKRFMSLAHAPLSISVVVAAATFIFQDCKINDVELRAEVFRVCLKRVATAKSEGYLVQLLQKHEPLAWTLLQGAEETRSKLAGTLEKSKKATAQSVESGERLIADVKKLAAEKRKLAETVSKKNDKVNDLTRVALTKDEEIQKLTAVNTDVYEVISEKDNRVRALTDDVRNKQNKIKNLNMEIEKLKARLSKGNIQSKEFRKHNEQMQMLTAENERLAEEVGRKTQSSNSLRGRNDELKAEINEIKEVAHQFGQHMNKAHSCRNCNNKFGANVDVDVAGHCMHFQLYCAHCDRNN